MALTFLGLKAFLLLAIARAYVIYDPLQRHWFFLSLLYTAFLAALSWVFVLNMRQDIPEQAWQFWLLKSFILVAVYFKLLAKFDEGMLFWIIFLGGWLALVWF